MEPRKNRIQTFNQKSRKKGVKTAVIALGITVLFGTGTVFGATNWGATVTNYASELVGIEKTEIQKVNTDAKEQELREHVALEKGRVDAIIGQGTAIKEEVETTIASEVDVIKGQITQAAEDAITDADTSLQEAKEAELTEHRANIDAIADEFTVETPAQ